MYIYKNRNIKLIEWCSICNKTFEIQTHNMKEYSKVLASNFCCNKCMIDLDEEIAEFVITLNNLGYLTHFSCAGHGIGYPGYIYFDKLGWKAYKNIKIACNNLKCIKFEPYRIIRFYSDSLNLYKTKTGNIYTKKNYDLYIKTLKSELPIFISKLPDISNDFNSINCKNGYENKYKK